MVEKAWELFKVQGEFFKGTTICGLNSASVAFNDSISSAMNDRLKSGIEFWRQHGYCAGIIPIYGDACTMPQSCCVPDCLNHSDRPGKQLCLISNFH